MELPAETFSCPAVDPGKTYSWLVVSRCFNELYFLYFDYQRWREKRKMLGKFFLTIWSLAMVTRTRLVNNSGHSEFTQRGRKLRK